jgi:hypothetical protein
MAAVSTSYFRAVSYLYLSTFSLPFIISHRFRTLSLSLSLSPRLRPIRKFKGTTEIAGINKTLCI